MTRHKQLNEKAWRAFGTNLKKKKGSTAQKEFLIACRADTIAFLDYMTTHLPPTPDNVIDGTTVSFNHKLTEQEFMHPPPSTQQLIWNVFKDVPPEVLDRCGFWGYIILGMLKNNTIKPSYLAAQPSYGTKSGNHVIDSAIKTGEAKAIDLCTRRILRSMCNPAPRGERIVVNDFYLGKSVWCWYWATELSQLVGAGITSQQILAMFEGPSYPYFAEPLHALKSHKNPKATLARLLLFLDEERKTGSRHSPT